APPLLPDTKLRKNIIQQILRRHLSGNLSQVVQRIPDVQRQQVSGDAVVNTFDDAIQGFVGFYEVVVVTKVGDDNIAGRDVQVVAGENTFFKLVEMRAVRGGDEDEVFVL